MHAPEIIYFGLPLTDEMDRCGKVYVRDGCMISELPLRLDLYNHSPGGFAWNYHGSGPAQLALALLAHASGNDRKALRHYQSFKEIWIAGFPPGEWQIHRRQILQWLAHAEHHSPPIPAALPGQGMPPEIKR